jgi:hypothetical protein
MKKRSYRSEIAKKTLEVTAAGANRGGSGVLFTENNLNKYIDMDGSNGTYELRIKQSADANQFALGQTFGKLVINPADFQKVENHAKTHTQGLTPPSQNLALYLIPHFNTQTQEFEPPVFVVDQKSTDDYRVLAGNFQKMQIKTTPKEQIFSIIENSRFSPVQFRFNYDSPLQKVLQNESYTTRQKGLRPTQNRKIKKRATKNHK